MMACLPILGSSADIQPMCRRCHSNSTWRNPTNGGFRAFVFCGWLAKNLDAHATLRNTELAAFLKMTLVKLGDSLNRQPSVIETLTQIDRVDSPRRLVGLLDFAVNTTLSPYAGLSSANPSADPRLRYELKTDAFTTTTACVWQPASGRRTSGTQ